MNAHYAGGVNNYLNSNHMKYHTWHNSEANFFAIWKISAAKFANCVAPAIDGSMQRLVRCKELQVLLTDGGKSVQVDP